MYCIPNYRHGYHQKTNFTQPLLCGYIFIPNVSNSVAVRSWVAAKIRVSLFSRNFYFRVLLSLSSNSARFRETRYRNLGEIFAISRNMKSKFVQHFCYFAKRDGFFIFKNVKKLFIFGTHFL